MCTVELVIASMVLKSSLSPGHGRAPRQAQGRHGRRETPRPPTSKAATLAPFANTPRSWDARGDKAA